MAPFTGLFFQQMRHSAFRGGGAILEGVGCSTCLIGCRLPPLDGYVAVCLVLIIEVYDIRQTTELGAQQLNGDEGSYQAKW